MADEGILDDPNYIVVDDGILDEPNYEDIGILDDPNYSSAAQLDDIGVIDDVAYQDSTNYDNDDIGILDDPNYQLDDDGILDDPNANRDINAELGILDDPDYNVSEQGLNDTNQYNIDDSHDSYLFNDELGIIDDPNYNVSNDKSQRAALQKINDSEAVKDNRNLNDELGIIDDPNYDVGNDKAQESLKNVDDSETMRYSHYLNNELGILHDPDYDLQNSTSNTDGNAIINQQIDNADELGIIDDSTYPIDDESVQDSNNGNDFIVGVDPHCIDGKPNSMNENTLTRIETNLDVAEHELPVRSTNKVISCGQSEVDASDASSTVKYPNSNRTLNADKDKSNASVEKCIEVSDNGQETLFVQNDEDVLRFRSHSDIGDALIDQEDNSSKTERCNSVGKSSNVSPPKNLNSSKKAALPSKLPSWKSVPANISPHTNKTTAKKSPTHTSAQDDKNPSNNQTAVVVRTTNSPSPRNRLKQSVSVSQLPSRLSRQRLSSNDKKITSVDEKHADPSNSKNTKPKYSPRHSVIGLPGCKISPRQNNTNSNTTPTHDKNRRESARGALTLGRKKMSVSTTNLSTIKKGGKNEKYVDDLHKDLDKAQTEVTQAKLEASKAIEEVHFLAAKAVEEVKIDASSEIKQAKQQAEQELLKLKFNTDKEIFQLTKLYKDQIQHNQDYQKALQKANMTIEALAIVVKVLQDKIDRLEKQVYIEAQDGEENLSTIDRLRLRHQENVKRLKEARLIMLKDINIQQAKKMASLEAKHQIAMSELQRRHNKEIGKMENRLIKIKREHEDKIVQINKDNHKSTSVLEDESVHLCNEIATLKDKLNELENTSSIEHDERVRAAVAKYENMPKELESLRAVLDLKFQEINRLKAERQEIAKQLLSSNQAKKYIKNLELRNEELEAIVNAKTVIEKENIAIITSLETELEIMKRDRNQLVLEMEQLRWKSSPNSK